MKTLMFPGQGSQSVGMGADLYKSFELVKKIFKQADEKLNFSISKIILNGPDSEVLLWPFIGRIQRLGFYWLSQF